MKKFKLLSVVAVCLAAFAFTSCNTGDDTYSYLTLEQQKAYQSNMAMAGTCSDMKILWDHKNDGTLKGLVADLRIYTILLNIRQLIGRKIIGLFIFEIINRTY